MRRQYYFNVLILFLLHIQCIILINLTNNIVRTYICNINDSDIVITFKYYYWLLLEWVCFLQIFYHRHVWMTINKRGIIFIIYLIKLYTQLHNMTRWKSNQFNWKYEWQEVSEWVCCFFDTKKKNVNIMMCHHIR